VQQVGGNDRRRPGRIEGRRHFDEVGADEIEAAAAANDLDALDRGEPAALGYISLVGLVLFVPPSILTAPLDARLAHALPKRRLEILFGVFLLVVAGRFLFDLVF
jgi:hypothetical protein